jgi:hypothetical protein
MTTRDKVRTWEVQKYNFSFKKYSVMRVNEIAELFGITQA